MGDMLQSAIVTNVIICSTQPATHTLISGSVMDIVSIGNIVMTMGSIGNSLSGRKVAVRTQTIRSNTTVVACDTHLWPCGHSLPEYVSHHYLGCCRSEGAAEGEKTGCSIQHK